MYTIGSDPRHSFYNTDHVCPCLQKLIRHDHSYVSGSYHQDPFSRKDSLHVYHSLCRSGSHNPRKRPARKTERIFCSPCAQKKFFSFYDLRFSIPQDCRPFIREYPDARTVQPYVYLDLFRFFQQLFPNIDPSDPGSVSTGAEKFMQLFKQLAPGLPVFIYQEHVTPVFFCLDSSSQPCRPSSYDHDFSFHFTAPLFPNPSCVSTTIPSSTGVIQVRTLGFPFTVMTQSVH